MISINSTRQIKKCNQYLRNTFKKGGRIKYDPDKNDIVCAQG